MTFGNKTTDSRITETLLWGYQNSQSRTVKHGSYFRKSWSGGDTPRTPQEKYEVQTVSHNVYDAKGRFLRIRTRKLRIYKKRRPPKSENPYSMSLTERVDTVPWVQLKNYAQPTYEPIDTSGYPCWAASYPRWDSNEELALIGRLADKIGAGFNLGVFLAEGRQSLQTIAGAATRIYQAFKAVKRGNVASAAKILFNGGRAAGGSRKPGRQSRERVRDLASDWLQLQYGWKPLLNDIFEACKYLAYLQDRPFTQNYRATKKVEWSGSKALGQYETWFGSSRERVTITAKITSVNEAALLGLTNPSSIAWEAVPFSFIADWFVPVGSYLEALNLRSALTGTFITSRVSDFRVDSLFQTETPGAHPVNIPVYVREYTFTRSVSSSLNVPMPTVQPLSKVATWLHAANAVSLIVQKFAR